MNKQFYLLMVTAFLFSVSIKAQRKHEAKEKEHVHMGLRLGANLNKYTVSNIGSGYYDNMHFKIGANISANLNIPIRSVAYFQPSLMITNKGAEIKNTVNNKIITQTAQITYLEVPLNIVTKHKVGNGFLLFGVGPYFSYGLWGTEKISGDPSVNKTYQVKFKNTVAATDPRTTQVYARPLDIGINMFVGYEFSNRFSAQIHGEIGVAKINCKYENQSYDGSLKNLSLGLSVGYRFHSWKK